MSNLKDEIEDAPWPPQCCVAAFLASALNQLGHSIADRGSIARMLHTRVGLHDYNPFNLMRETDTSRLGVTPTDAEALVPSVLKEFDIKLFFRHIPFSHVTLELYPELLEQCSQFGGVVGIGFNYSRIYGGPGILRHVCRILDTHSDEVLLRNDSLGSRHDVRVSWVELEQAVQDVPDGYWIVGPERAMKLECAWPWPENAR